MDGTLLIGAGTALMCSLGIWESHRHRRNLAGIPFRIHVNGTRGKSAVTRLIAAGLRAGGLRTCTTTGTLPRMIFPDGQEYPVFRPSRANVKEQIRVVRTARQLRAEALVIECMALQPSLQSLSEQKMVRATHGVITNARADHLDVMGPTVKDVARSLCGTVPTRGTLFTTEQRHLPILADVARCRESRLWSVGDNEVGKITSDEMTRFSYIEHPENVALALAVCRDLGIARQTALSGMWQAQPDPGVMTVYQATEAGSQISFVNGFAANDPESTGLIWEMMVRRMPAAERRIAVVNCRVDRPDRSRQLAEACVRWSPADHYVVIGSAPEVFVARAAEAGLDRGRVSHHGVDAAERLAATIGRFAGRSAMVMGMGNISGPGLALVDYYRRRQTPPPVASALLGEAA